MSKLKRIKRFVIVGLLAGILFSLTANLWIEFSSRNKCYNSVNDIPHNKVGIVLGTSNKLRNGNENLYFRYRVNAAARLFKAKKVDLILVSGDNSTKYYDEPNTFKKALIKKGVPAKAIHLDYAGFRTLDSMHRLKEVFQQNKATVISQSFHNERAIFLGRHFGVDAIGFNARDVGGPNGKKVKFREFFARTKAGLDLLFGKKAKFLGKTISI